MAHLHTQLIAFGMIQARASVFGAVLLFFIILTEFIYPSDFFLHRYDFLLLTAVLTQIFLVVTKMESIKEVKVILIFHFVATGMELFKTLPSIGSWAYPGAEDALFSLGTVPLFAGFMYSAVGSFIARAWRLMALKFDPFPQPWVTLSLSFLIYLNFFIHHYIWDLRYILLTASLGLYWKTTITFTVGREQHKMPFLLAAFLTAFFVWIAENIATFSSIWLYPNQKFGWQLVSPDKMLAWYLLLLLSFGLVSLLYKERRKDLSNP
ncbi:DUF817 domain-containing protein [Temperatibacter marinus]|uniref:DUF817 domain-containing protein n=1 Tax=Temperatibacter marinus TaxID=1456591 RepID=A0AA52EHE3_9PROT|nr:DUF817 domain-containing protein [Temperatibacter marinus]WND02554.1 DUF817 domain-containing protein [Temperatibacter marinus]